MMMLVVDCDALANGEDGDADEDGNGEIEYDEFERFW